MGETSMLGPAVPTSNAPAKFAEVSDSAEPCLDKSWYVVCCKPRQENVAAQNLLRQNFEIYYPQLASRQRRRGQGRWETVIQPLFPRYLFLRADRHRQSLAVVRSTCGAVGLVRFGSEPAVMPDAMVRAIAARANAANGLHIEAVAVIAAGSQVRVQEGPFAGFDALCAGPDGETRTLLLIELLGKTNTVSVPRECVAPAA